MEELLLPLKPTSPSAKVPYVAQERYDGLPFLGYAKRRGKLNIDPPSADFTYVPMHNHQKLHPPPHEEQEAFFQTWLFFGLLSEFFQGNAAEESQTTSDTPNEALDYLYTNFIYEEDGKKYVTTARFLPIIDALIATPDREIEDVENIKSRLNHMGYCLRYASSLLLSCSVDFNPEIKLSIAAMGECLMHIISADIAELNMEQNAFCLWSRGSLTSRERAEMIRNGWCPSDITKCSNSFDSVHALHFVSKMDRSQPPRNHTRCTEQACKAGQIDLNNYHVGHVAEGCNCQLLTIDNTTVIEILKKKDLVPVLKIYNGEKGLNNLRVEVIESATTAKYIAISHVWVDGLGNPFANSLYRCQIAQLRDLVQGITEFAPQNEKDRFDGEEDSALLWLDTLCCPVEPPSAKRIALEKIRNVYEGAAGVLVLDSNLRSYPFLPMTVFEAFARISVCSWTRRLWTLQEGALAKAIVFQFADRCVSLSYLYNELQNKYSINIYYRSFIWAIRKEMDVIRSFFFAGQSGRQQADLPVLDVAMKHRSVTVPTDEALCISTLMSLDSSAVLSVPEEDRMRVVWEQLIQSKSGVPAGTIFFSDPRLECAGFRWAPTSLLGFSDFPEEYQTMHTRDGHWKTPRSERLTSRGLQVRFPGFRIRQKAYSDGLPHDPWAGSLKDKNGRPKSIVECFIQFRNEEDQWFRFCKQETKSNGRLQTCEEEREWKLDMEHPLYEMSSTGRCALLLHHVPSSQEDPYKSASEGLIVSIRSGDVPEDSQVDTEGQPPLYIRSEGHILAYMCRRSEILALSTCERIATQLRGSELTRKLCAIKDQEGEEYQRVMDELKGEMRRLMKEALDSSQDLVDAVNAGWNDFLDDIWKYIANWYRQDIFIGEMLPENQIWIVD